MWTKQIKRKERDWLFNRLLTNKRMRERKKRKVLNLFFPFLRVCQFNIENDVSQTKAMYNTSGSDIDIEEFEYHSGSRKVSKN